MPLSEHNPNIMSASSADGKHEKPWSPLPMRRAERPGTCNATFVRPPRTTTSASPAHRQPTHVASTSALPKPHVMVAETDCGCPTCFYYHAYKKTCESTDVVGYMNTLTSCAERQLFLFNAALLQQQQQQQLYAPAAPLGLTGAPAAPGRPRTALRSVSAVPVLSMKRPALADCAMPPCAAEVQPLSWHELLDALAGRAVERACTAGGRVALRALLQDPASSHAVLERLLPELCDGLDVLALDANGARVLWTAMEVCTAEHAQKVVAALHEALILNMCTVSQYTRRALQTLFERRLVKLDAVVQVLTANVHYLAATQQGCISLMRVYEQCDAAQQAVLIAKLLPSLRYLALDQFGNYVVQCVVERSDPATAAAYTLRCFGGHWLPLSCDKFASNVVEKVIRTLGEVPAVRRVLLDELIYNPASLQQMVHDGYGNFVVQSLLESVGHAGELRRMADRLRAAIVDSPYAARIEAKLRAKKVLATNAPSATHHKMA